MTASFARFVAAGAVNTAVTYLLFLELCQWIPAQLAYTAVYMLGIALSYVLNAVFVFRTRFSVRSALRFPLTYAAQYVYGLVMLSFLSSVLHFSNAIAMALIVATNVPLTFVLTRLALRAPG